MKLKEFIDRTGKFLRDVRAEMDKVIWPSRQQAALYTGVVVAAVVLVSALIFVIDQALGVGVGALLKLSSGAAVK